MAVDYVPVVVLYIYINDRNDDDGNWDDDNRGESDGDDCDNGVKVYMTNSYMMMV